jgi:uncharacterized membrane protein
MLDRRAMLVVAALVLAMLAAAIWLVVHAGRGPITPFLAPFCVVTVVAVLSWRLRSASGDRAAWAAWCVFFAVSYAVICAAFQLLLVLVDLKVIAPPGLPWVRFFFAVFGAQFFVLGNWMAKLPPPGFWRPAWLSLSAIGEAAILRFGGWLFVFYGLIVIASAVLLPMNLITPMVVSLSLALVIVVGVRRRQLRTRE